MLADSVALAENDVKAAILVVDPMDLDSIPEGLASEAKIALKTLGDTKKTKASIKAVEEFFKVNERVIDSMVAFKEILTMLYTEFQEFQVPEIQSYLKQLDDLILAYEKLNLAECIQSSETPEEVMIALHKKMVSPFKVDPIDETAIPYDLDSVQFTLEH